MFLSAVATALSIFGSSGRALALPNDFVLPEKSSLSGLIGQIYHERMDVTSRVKTSAVDSLLTWRDKNLLLVEVTAMAGDGTLQPSLEQYGFLTAACSTYKCSGYLDITNLPMYLGLETVRSITPSMSITNCFDGQGSVKSQAVLAHKVNETRCEFTDLDGTGTRIGILSDSYNTLGGADAGIASGDLPIAGVGVLRELPTQGSDEGRAMAELVHDMAPGAEILFHTAFGGIPVFANGIRALAENGCDVIVDDVSKC